MNETIKPSDNLAYRYPVSIKGIVLLKTNEIPLLKNERNEYELPGGKLEPSEQPEDCIVREIKEELNINVEVIKLIDSWLYTIDEETKVVIITYLCKYNGSKNNISFSKEHKSMKIIKIDNVDKINMPKGYKESVQNVKGDNCVKKPYCGDKKLQ